MEGQTLAPLCARNAQIAHLHGQYDHEMFWTAMGTLISPPSSASLRKGGLGGDGGKKKDDGGYKILHPGNHPLAAKMIKQL